MYDSSNKKKTSNHPIKGSIVRFYNAKGLRTADFKEKKREKENSETTNVSRYKE